MSSRPLKIGIMSFAHMHAESYADCVNGLTTAELAGIADDDPERGSAAADRHGTTFFNSYEELLALPGLGAVIICSENVRHRDLAIMAAEAGKHVLCEKPLATTIADASAMIATCHDRGVKLQTAFPCRYGAATIRAKQAIEAGGIGRVLAIKGTNRGKMPGGWFTDVAKSGGGAVMDHTVHVADLMRWVLGSEFAEVYAEISNQLYHQDYDDTGTLAMQFENGVFATLDCSWSRPKSYPFWGDVMLEFTATGGVVAVDLFAQKMNVFPTEAAPGRWEYWGDKLDLWMVRDFVRCVAEAAPVCVTGDDGLKALEVALAAYESAKVGGPVKLPLVV